MQTMLVMHWIFGRDMRPGRNLDVLELDEHVTSAAADVYDLVDVGKSGKLWMHSSNEVAKGMPDTKEAALRVSGTASVCMMCKSYPRRS